MDDAPGELAVSEGAEVAVVPVELVPHAGGGHPGAQRGRSLRPVDDRAQVAEAGAARPWREHPRVLLEGNEMEGGQKGADALEGRQRVEAHDRAREPAEGLPGPVPVEPPAGAREDRQRAGNGEGAGDPLQRVVDPGGITARRTEGTQHRRTAWTLREPDR